MKRVKVYQLVEDREEINIFCIDNLVTVRTWDNRIDVFTTHNSYKVEREDFRKAVIDLPKLDIELDDFDKFVMYIEDNI